MKTVLVGMVTIGLGTSALAQQTMPSASLPAIATSPVSAGYSGLEYGSAATRAGEAFPFRSSLETPTMRRQKLAQAIALRDEALALQAQDGGVLTNRHVRAI